MEKLNLENAGNTEFVSGKYRVERVVCGVGNEGSRGRYIRFAKARIGWLLFTFNDHAASFAPVSGRF